VSPVCTYCGVSIDSARNAYRRVVGWEHKSHSESRRGGSDITLREQLDVWACSGCIARKKAGVDMKQEALL
jgi:hypothetical protein